MSFKLFLKKFVSLCLGGLFLSLTILAQTVPSPKEVIGFTPGDDRKLASWNQVVDYFQKLDAASDRLNFEEIGKTTMGAPFVYATISSPETENRSNIEGRIAIRNGSLALDSSFFTSLIFSSASS